MPAKKRDLKRQGHPMGNIFFPDCAKKRRKKNFSV
jgi:hypothetical protein